MTSERSNDGYISPRATHTCKGSFESGEGKSPSRKMRRGRLVVVLLLHGVLHSFLFAAASISISVTISLLLVVDCFTSIF